ncbi:MAG: hypothetical protein IPN52_01295 [Micrococcales bacterium]|nr:hypothetical protein [Micrococcales bacterium]
MDAEWFGYAGAALMTAMSLPQIARIVRDRSAAGVSLLTWTLFVLAGTGWLSYGLILQAPAIIVGNLTFISTTVTVVVLLLRRQRSWPLLSASLVPLLAVALAVAALTRLPGAVASSLGVLLGIATTVPQLVESIGRRRAGLVSEVSLAALFMLLAGQALWLTYGLTRPDLPMIVANVVAVTVTSSLIVVESRVSAKA